MQALRHGPVTCRRRMKTSGRARRTALIVLAFWTGMAWRVSDAGHRRVAGSHRDGWRAIAAGVAATPGLNRRRCHRLRSASAPVTGTRVTGAAAATAPVEAKRATAIGRQTSRHRHEGQNPEQATPTMHQHVRPHVHPAFRVVRTWNAAKAANIGKARPQSRQVSVSPDIHFSFRTRMMERPTGPPRPSPASWPGWRPRRASFSRRADRRRGPAAGCR